MSYRRSPPSSFPGSTPTSPISPNTTGTSRRPVRASPSIIYTDSDPDENFPPSISQRHPPRSPLRYAQLPAHHGPGGHGGTIDMRGRSVSGSNTGAARLREVSGSKGAHGPAHVSGRGGVDSSSKGSGPGSDSLLLPHASRDEPRGLKQKRSFERTKAWAAGLDPSEMVDSEGAGSLTSDDACMFRPFVL